MLEVAATANYTAFGMADMMFKVIAAVVITSVLYHLDPKSFLEAIVYDT